MRLVRLSTVRLKANGVVLITTKQGREGKAQISFDAYYGIQNVARKANMLNAKEYMAIMDEQALNSGLSAYDWSQYQSIYDANGNVYDTDWVDTMFKDNATTESYTLVSLVEAQLPLMPFR